MSKSKKHRYFIIHKPYGMLSQFTPEHGKLCLADLNYKFPKNVYPVGRLDQDSEGLLLLTNDKHINSELLSPEKQHRKTYLTQVEGIPSAEALDKLETGVEIRAKGVTHFTAPAKAELITKPEWLIERVPPVRKDKTTSFIKLTITEGKNRQVRKMTASVGLPTLRLIRVGIESLSIDGLSTGQVMELSRNTAYRKMNL